MNAKILPHIALIAVNLIYGINYVVAKGITPEYVPPFAFVVLRVVPTTILFFLFHRFYIREKVERKDIPKLMICGLTGVATNQLLFFKGLSLTTAINASVLMISTPILVLFFSSIMLKERLNIFKILGIILGCIGAIFLVLNRSTSQFGGGNLFGDMLILMNAASYSLYLVLVKPLMRKYKPLTVMQWVFFFGMLVVLPIGAPSLSAIQFPLPTGTIFGIIYVILIVTFLAYLLNIYALSKVNASVVGAYIYTQPIIASVLAILFMNESLNGATIIATVCIAIGVFLVNYKSPKRNLSDQK